MWELLSSYWWIILLLLIVVAVITRSLTKFFIGSAIVFGILTVISELFFTPALRSGTRCFDEGIITINSNVGQAKLMNSDEGREQFLCTASEEQFATLVSCFRNIERTHSLGYSMITRLPKIKSIFTETVIDHNNTCPDNPISAPSL